MLKLVDLRGRRDNREQALARIRPAGWGCELLPLQRPKLGQQVIVGFLVIGGHSARDICLVAGCCERHIRGLYFVLQPGQSLEPAYDISHSGQHAIYCELHRDPSGRFKVSMRASIQPPQSEPLRPDFPKIPGECTGGAPASASPSG